MASATDAQRLGPSLALGVAAAGVVEIERQTPGNLPIVLDIPPENRVAIVMFRISGGPRRISGHPHSKRLIIKEARNGTKPNAPISVSINEVGVISNELKPKLYSVFAHRSSDIVENLIVLNPVAESPLGAESSGAGNA